MNWRYDKASVLAIAAVGLLVGFATTGGSNAQSPAAVPPPPDQGVVDCGQPIYAIDTLICGDPRLTEQNDRMRSLLNGAVLPTIPSDGWVEPQQDWFRRRAMCASQSDGRACVADAYSERLAVLASLRAPRGNDLIAISCRPSPWNGGVYADRLDGDIVVLRDKDGALRAVAMKRFRSSWRAFVEVGDGDRKTIKFQSATRTLRCASPKNGR